jgi:glycosyltransferase involved in cell wall biosynthesis
MPCPETEEQLKAIAMQFDKVEWVRVNQHDEADHRNIAFSYTHGFDLLLAVDADEVWDTISLRKCLAMAVRGEVWRYNILGFINFWKSFNHVCDDFFAPGRIYNLNRRNEKETSIQGTVYHFGYAQSKATIDYKMSIHGHKSELRADWMQVYENWTPETCYLHPASLQAWELARPFNKNILPQILKQHPNFTKESI